MIKEMVEKTPNVNVPFTFQQASEEHRQGNGRKTSMPAISLKSGQISQFWVTFPNLSIHLCEETQSQKDLHIPYLWEIPSPLVIEKLPVIKPAYHYNSEISLPALGSRNAGCTNMCLTPSSFF